MTRFLPFISGNKGITVSAAIKQKLYELKEKVEKLEAATQQASGKVEEMKRRPPAGGPGAVKSVGVKQNDLFTVLTGGQQKDNTATMKSMASRLDSTIEKVEELLRQ